MAEQENVSQVEYKTTQSGIRSFEGSLNNVDLFRGMLKLDAANIGNYDFMVGGYGFFYWLSGPTFMTQTGNTSTLGALWNKFKAITEKGSTSFDGINDLSANTEDITGGIAGNSFKQVTNIKDDFDSFTIKCYEYQGSPLRETLQTWLNGIRDYKIGLANYAGQINTYKTGEGASNKLEYSAKNHTAEAAYIVTDPSGFGVEYTCLLTNIIPTKVPKSHLNMSHGDHPLVQMDLEFSATMYESAYINEQLATYHRNQMTLQSYLDFEPSK